MYSRLYFTIRRQSYCGYSHYLWVDLGRSYSSGCTATFNTETSSQWRYSSLILWELEQVPQSDVFSAADHSALQHFDDHYEVLPDGRYSVALPWVNNPPPLGDSRSMSLRRFSQNERSLIKKGKLQDFNAVMKEYLTLDHAELVPNEDLLHPPKDVFYLPIHGVLRFVHDYKATCCLRRVC